MSLLATVPEGTGRLSAIVAAGSLSSQLASFLEGGVGYASGSPCPAGAASPGCRPGALATAKIHGLS